MCLLGLWIQHLMGIFEEEEKGGGREEGGGVVTKVFMPTLLWVEIKFSC